MNEPPAALVKLSTLKVMAPASGRMSKVVSVSLSVPPATVVPPVRVLLAVPASTQVPAPIFISERALVPLFVKTEVMVLSPVLLPPSVRVLAPATELVMAPLTVRAPVPLALRKALTVVVLIVIGRLRVAAGPV